MDGVFNNEDVEGFATEDDIAAGQGM
jgi:hypothetical protein